MKSRIKALERRLRLHNAPGGAPVTRYFVGDGQRWRETVFDYSHQLLDFPAPWLEFTPAPFTNATLAALEARGVTVVRVVRASN